MMRRIKLIKKNIVHSFLALTLCLILPALFLMPAASTNLFLPDDSVMPDLPYVSEVADNKSSTVAARNSAETDFTGSINLAENIQPIATDDTLLAISDMEVPLFNGLGLASWALLNLILSVASILLTVIMLFLAIIRQKDDYTEEDGEIEVPDTNKQGSEEKKRPRNSLLLLFSVITAISAMILFILTQDMTRLTVLADWWTLGHILLFAVNLLCYMGFSTYTKESGAVIRYNN